MLNTLIHAQEVKKLSNLSGTGFEKNYIIFGFADKLFDLLINNDAIDPSEAFATLL